MQATANMLVFRVNKMKTDLIKGIQNGKDGHVSHGFVAILNYLKRNPEYNFDIIHE